MAKQVHRLVIDTNVFISGLISAHGSPAKILNAVRNGSIVHLVSDPIVDEYLRVLEYPRIRKFKKITDEFVLDVSAYLIHQTERVEIASQITLSPDPDDNMFLEAAIDGDADMVVTGDKAHLLSLKTINAIPIVSVSETVKRLKLE